PAVDVLFQSLAKGAGENVLALLLTGMGRDGAEGMLQLRGCGAETIAQDEASSIVYGMPQAAMNLGAAQRQLPLDQMAGAVVDFVKRRSRL
nr:CheB methylesterase domain-containing protein [Spirochaetaceae bacterium]